MSLIEVSTGKERCLVTELPRDYRAEEGNSEGARALAFSLDGKILAVAKFEESKKAMKALEGQGNPQVVNQLLDEKLTAG